MAPRISLSLRVIAAGVALVGCVGMRGQPPAPSAVEAAGANAPAVKAGSTDGADLNRELVGQVIPAEKDADLPLGPGDLIEVSVFDVPELSNLKLRIPNSGNITLPLIGAVPAAGLTAVELQDGIRDLLQQKYMHHPQVSLFVHEHRSQRISVIGAVRTGGVFTLSSHLRLADALAMAGGLSEEAGHMAYVIRRVPADLVASARANGASPPERSPLVAAARTEQLVTTVDLESLAAGKRELNLPLQAGDVIEVPRAGSFYVGGEVNRPGSFPLKSRTTLEQAPVAAGGLKDPADWDDVRLYRTRRDGTREVMTFSLNEFEKGKPGPEIERDDVIIVGKSGVKAFLYGLRDFFRFGWGASVPIK